MEEYFTALQKGDIAIDCGANVGKVTSKMAECGAKVFAFEPNPFAFKVLKKKFRYNFKVKCFNKGVLDKNTKLKLYFHKNSDADEVKWSTGSSFLSEKSNVNNTKYKEVDVIDLCEFIEKLNKPIALLKLDVEGVEIEILNKLIDTGTIHKIKQVLVETHDDKIEALKDKTNALRERIKVEKIDNINLDWI
jgi:FkbM family methyltransferase